MRSFLPDLRSFFLDGLLWMVSNKFPESSVELTDVLDEVLLDEGIEGVTDLTLAVGAFTALATEGLEFSEIEFLSLSGGAAA